MQFLGDPRAPDMKTLARSLPAPLDRCAALEELSRIDLAWQHEREAYLDNGEEPEALDARELVAIALFFPFTWGFSVVCDAWAFVPAAAATSVVSLSSLRSNGFQRAYQAYRHARAKVVKLRAMHEVALRSSFQGEPHEILPENRSVALPSA